MTRIRLRSLSWRALLAIACALAATGCAPAAGDRPASAGGDGSVLRLFPDPAHASARIAVVFGESGLDRSKCRFEWRRNGFVIPGATESQLEPSRFTKGDLITVLVSVPTTPGEDAKTVSAEVKVTNTPPQIDSVVLEMFAAPGGSEVKAIVASADPDGEHPHLDYEWFHNGVLVEGVRGASLSATDLARGDRVRVAVVARDDESASPSVESRPFVVENLPPAFSSQPGTLRNGDAEFQYQAVALDPDGDPLLYELMNAPEGMSVSPKGEIHWALPKGDLRRGEYPVRIRAADSKGGEAVQAFTIQLGGVPPAR